MKKKIFKRISIIVLVILCIASISFAAITLNATEVTYDKNGTTVSVKDALDELHEEIANAPKKVFSQGQLVTYKGEEFYALYDVSEIETTMEIFAKTSLNQEATAQANDTYSNTKCTFSSTNYWSSLWTSGTRLNLNNVTGYTSTDVLGRVDTYARTKGAIRGRLLTYDEANTLRSSFGDMIYGRGNTAQTNSSGLGYEIYYLGSSRADNRNHVYNVSGDDSSLSDSYYTGSAYGRGVRPVLTVYKSDVSSDVSSRVQCSDCSGTGSVTGRCSACNGAGYTESYQGASIWKYYGCTSCGGSGSGTTFESGDEIEGDIRYGTGIATSTCSTCGGDGWIND